MNFDVSNAARRQLHLRRSEKHRRQAEIQRALKCVVGAARQNANAAAQLPAVLTTSDHTVAADLDEKDLGTQRDGHTCLSGAPVKAGIERGAINRERLHLRCRMLD